MLSTGRQRQACHPPSHTRPWGCAELLNLEFGGSGVLLVICVLHTSQGGPKRGDETEQMEGSVLAPQAGPR